MKSGRLAKNERRFQPILGHGVDYFYHWMVEVLGKGDPETLGEYPYSSNQFGSRIAAMRVCLSLHRRGWQRIFCVRQFLA